MPQLIFILSGSSVRLARFFKGVWRILTLVYIRPPAASTCLVFLSNEN